MKKLKEKIESLNLNYKNELIKILFVNVFIFLIGAGGFLFFGSYLILILMVLGLGISNFFLFNRYIVLSLNKEEEKLIELIDVFLNLRIYLNNKFNLRSALNFVKEYTNEEIRGRITTLLSEMEEDDTAAPFLQFSKYYKSKAIDELMYLLYEMKNGKNKRVLYSFNNLLIEIKQNQDKKLIEKRTKSFDYINLLTILGGAILIIILSLGIIGLIGEFNINGS